MWSTSLCCGGSVWECPMENSETQLKKGCKRARPKSCESLLGKKGFFSRIQRSFFWNRIPTAPFLVHEHDIEKWLLSVVPKDAAFSIHVGRTKHSNPLCASWTHAKIVAADGKG